MKYLLVTNNDRAAAYCGEKMETLFLKEGSYLDVLYKVRDLIHAGRALYSHPLAGSLKPNQTPYKSIVLGDGGEDKYGSVILIESAIETAEKFLRFKSTPAWPDKIREDFKTVDLSFIRNFADGLSRLGA